MDFDFQDLVDAIVSHALALGVFASVNGHQPQSIPTVDSDITCAVWTQEIEPFPEGSGLSSTTGRVEMNMRLYSSLNQEPQDAIDPGLMNAVSKVFAAFSGDFTLDGTVRDVELLQMGAKAGYIPQDDQTLRVMTITIPIVINDMWDQVASS